MTSLVGIVICATVAGSAPLPVDFDTQIIPLLTKSGCNSGACHGAAVGRGGFHLSLYGSDPAADFAAITQQWEGRRINTTRPERSLVLRKPIADLDHGGDQRFESDSESAALILRWIREGAARTPRRSLVEIKVSPDGWVANKSHEQVTLQVLARFDDGTDVDVTRWAVITPEDSASLQVIADGQLEVLRPGRHLALVRYLDRVQAMHISLPYRSQLPPPAPRSRQNQIDDEILAQLQVLGLECSPQADDATFLRRVTLHLTGRLPGAEDAEAFLADTTTSRRGHLVDELLASEAFADYWTYELAKLLRLRPIGSDSTAAETYRDWVRGQLNDRQPYDVMARQLLTASGDTHQNGPATFHRVISGPREQAEFVSELFMGVRLRCANCHDHPLDRWTQDDYHGLAAIFARLDRGRVVSVGQRGEVSHPRTLEAAVPRLPGSEYLSTDFDPRPALAEWLTSEDNPYFARAIVNRLWKHMLGRGLVEPIDDLRSTNPGTHPQLLEWLARDFVRHGYDLRHTLKLIASSAVYQRSAQATPANAIDGRFYSHYLPAPLEAEVLADAVADVTGASFTYGDHPLGTRAVALIDPQVPAPSLDILGRCGRDESCESSTSSGGVAVKLHLLNGPFLNAILTREDGLISQLLASSSSDEVMVEQCYLRAFSRRPTQSEQAFWQKEFAAAGDDRRAVAEDFLWSILTSREFTTNH